jgi:hypothetical protein
VRFRYDRTREVVLSRLAPQRRRTLQLVIARRPAAVPELFAVAAGQYLPVIDAVSEAAERLMERANGYLETSLVSAAPSPGRQTSTRSCTSGCSRPTSVIAGASPRIGRR